jgi:PAS domain S-box-containing protein
VNGRRGRLRRTSVRVGLLLLVALASVSAPGAAPYVPRRPDPILEPWRWRSFPELAGLGLRSMAESPGGKIWFGTDHGALSYNGIAWDRYGVSDGLPDSPVNALCTGADGALLAGTDWGIFRLEGVRWVRVFPWRPGLPWPVDDLLQASDGALWAATAWGALRLTGDRARLYTSREMVPALRQVEPALVVIPVPEAVVPEHPWYSRSVGMDDARHLSDVGLQLAEGGWLGIPRGQTPVTVWAVAPGSSADSVGIALGDRVLSIEGRAQIAVDRLSGEDGSYVGLKVLRAASGDTADVRLVRGRSGGPVRGFPVYDVMESANGDIWLGLWDGKVVRLASGAADRPEGWRLFSQTDGLRTGYGPRLYQSHSGDIWLVSNGPGGVNRYDGTRWRIQHAMPVSAGTIHTGITEPVGGVLWLGGGYLNQLREGTWSSYFGPHLDVPLPSHRLQFLNASDGAVWLGGLGQDAVRYDGTDAEWATFKGLSCLSAGPDGSVWFKAQGDSLVCWRTGIWTVFTSGDGLMDAPATVVAAADGSVWAAGSHGGVAATARYDGHAWTRQLHPGLSRHIRGAAVYAAPTGDLWFGATGDFRASEGQTGGLLRYRPGAGEWDHFHADETTRAPYAVTRTGDGTVWVGSNGLMRFRDGAWTTVSGPEGVSSWIQSLAVDGDDNLWVGTRLYGLYRLKGSSSPAEGAWTRYTTADGLADNWVHAVRMGPDGTVWASTMRGVSRFDGNTWTAEATPHLMDAHSVVPASGYLWINTPGGVIRYLAHRGAPETVIHASPAELSYPGNTVITWSGSDAWRATPPEDLQYAWRLNGGAWSAFSHQTRAAFASLRDGAYTFEAVSRDRDHNTDPTPAVLHFRVEAPVWKQTWFHLLMVLLLGGILVQSVRVLRRARNLRLANSDLKHSEERFRGIAESVRAPIVMATPEGRIVYWNPAAAVVFGRPAEKVMGQDLVETLVPLRNREKSRRILAKLQARSTRPAASGVLQVPLTRSTGEEFPAEVSITRAVLNGRPHVLFVARDISERIRAAEIAREAERARIVVETAGAAAHEINQPLQVVTGLAELLAMEGGVSPQTLEDLERIRDAGKRIHNIIKRMEETQGYLTRSYVRDVDIVEFGSGAG